MTTKNRVISIILPFVLMSGILLMIFLTFLENFGKILVKSTLDSNYYLVKPGKNQQKTADILAEINKNLLELISSLRSENPVLSKNIQLLRSRYRSGILSENIDLSQTSYTVNKGTEMAICITTRDSNESIYDKNLLMFVCIHELAHVGTETVGHTLEFIKFFKFLLSKSIEKGIYTFVDYSKKPTEYCGMTIKSTPISRSFGQY